MSKEAEAREEFGAARSLLAFASFLRMTGHPDRLDEVAEGLERSPEPRLQDAARNLRDLSAAARAILDDVEADGFRFDPETRKLCLPTGRRGPAVKLTTLAVVAAFRDLAPEQGMYTGEIFQAIRERLSPVLRAEDVERLTDATIRRALERWV